MNNSTSFWIICEKGAAADQCHCDWRTTIENCIETNPMYYMYIVNAALSAIISVIGTMILLYRVKYKKLPIFDIKSSSTRFFIRPRPIESLLLFGIIFNALRTVDTLLLVTSALPNTIVRAFLYELPWQFGLCAFACYLFGIAHTVVNSSRVIKKSWFRSSVPVDICCTVLILCPFITNNVCSVAAAVFAEQGNFYLARLFTRILYFLWTFYCLLLAVWILFAGFRLLKILDLHLKNQKDGITVNKIKTGAFKVKMIMAISVTSLLVFSFVKLIYGMYRIRILSNIGFNLAMASIWTFDGTTASLLVVVTLLINPKALTPLGSSTANGESSSREYNASNSYLAPDSRTKSFSYTRNNESNYTTLQDAPKSLMYQGGYPLASSDDTKKYYTSYIVPSNFEQSGISETHLVNPTSTEK